jgi:hypothetical protein
MLVWLLRLVAEVSALFVAGLYLARLLLLLVCALGAPVVVLAFLSSGISGALVAAVLMEIIPLVGIAIIETILKAALFIKR